ncbi:hypothetical protein IWW48_001419 [Coemansia sp. RSA 1200]|nr:hypothetical protein IWW48_001419 [Coemansia sp. RSA 1200]
MSDTGRSDDHDDDEFGGFGVENYDDGEDFGDFGDFGEQTSPHPQIPDPESHNVDSSRNSQHNTATTDIPSSLSVIDSTLAQAAPLLDNALSDHARGETLEECISNIFSNLPDCNDSSKIDIGEPKLDKLRLDNNNYYYNDDDGPCIATTTTGTTNADETVAAVLRRNTSTREEMEPRLLRNLLLVSVASESLDSRDIRYLLTPLSKIIIDLEAHKKKHSKKLPLLTVEEIQAIALSQEQQPSLPEDLAENNPQGNGVDDDDDNVLGALKHALVSIDALIAAKVQEIDKRRDDIVAYNQVIQKLIAQASKLH